MQTSEPATTENPLFGGKQKVSLSTFVIFGKKIPVLPATLVPSERAFSTAGHILNKNRPCLQPSSVEYAYVFVWKSFM